MSANIKTLLDNDGNRTVNRKVLNENITLSASNIAGQTYRVIERVTDNVIKVIFR